MKPTTISQAFSALTDPRMDRRKRHPLINIITISICAIIAGCDDFCSIEEYGKSKRDWFAQFLDLSQGIPSHDTFCDVLNRLNPKEELGHVMDRLFQTTNVKQQGGAIGLLTNGLATRQSSYEQALILALAKITNAKLFNA